MKVLITGGGGFLGSHVAEGFLKRGDEVYALDLAATRKVRHLLANPRFHYIKASVLDVDAMEAYAVRCDLIYHLAAVVGVEHYVDDPFNVLNVNVLGTINALKLAHRHEKRLVFASTSELYGRNPKVPWREDDDRVLGSTQKDRWCYSTSKAVGEHYCWAYHRMGLPVSVVRYFNAYGPRLDKVDAGRVITIFMGQLLRNEPITVIGDGRQTRCFTYVADIVRGTMAAGLEPAAIGLPFNIGTEKETAVLDLARTMNRISGRDPDMIRFVRQEAVYGESYEDIPRRVPSIERAAKILKFAPSISLDEGLRETIAWFRQEEEEARAHAQSGAKSDAAVKR